MEGEKRPVRVAIAIPSYKGPHRDCFDEQYQIMHYFGRLQERSSWLNHPDPVIRERAGPISVLPRLDRGRNDGLPELQPGDPEFQFLMATEVGNSLIGMARDHLIARALTAECDYILFFDDDIIFARDAFLRLWRHQKPVVGALAFTAREPIAPVIWRFKRQWNFQKQREDVDLDCMWNYPKNQLFQVDAIGTGLVLMQLDVFRKIPRPWFHGALSAGEDIHWCWQLYKAGIPIYCDSSVKTLHMPNVHDHFMDELHYLKSRSETLPEPIEEAEVCGVPV